MVRTVRMLGWRASNGWVTGPPLAERTDDSAGRTMLLLWIGCSLKQSGTCVEDCSC